VRQVLVSGAEQPNLFLDVGSTFQVGLEALFCHVSQIGDRAEVEAGVRERAEERGKLAGMALASAFLSITLD
jgi:LmbE family N-acetylglucosaminyl deacetylase